MPGVSMPGEQSVTDEHRLTDASARDRVRRDLDETLFVEAGAGTGKTSALVSRIVALIDSGRAQLGEIAAISFTEAAAAELRERIRRALVDRDDSVDSMVLRLRTEAATELDEAAITTIHGFAHRILAEHPLESGLPLRFEVLDEIGASLVSERRYSTFLDTLYDDIASRDLVAAAELLRVTPDHIRSLLARMDERRESALGEDAAIGGDDNAKDGARPEHPSELGLISSIAPAVGSAAAATVAAARAVALMRSGALDDEDYLFVRVTEMEAELGRLPVDADWLDQLGWLVELREQRVGNLGRQEAWGGPSVGEVRDAVRCYEQTRLGGIAAVADVVMAALGSRLETEVRAFADDRRKAGILQFHDLLVLSKDLVTTREVVRRDLQRRYRYILVDEFQDTDPLQLELVLALGRDIDTGRIVPGRLFFVGDPMQSIYRFRGADLSSYHGTRMLLGETAPVRLTTNFRSVPGVLEFVNAAFGRLVAAPSSAADGAPDAGPGSGCGGEEASPLVQLDAVRNPLPGRLPVVVIGAGDEKLSARARRERESADVATIIAEAVGGGWPVEVDGEIRTARYGDVAVLVPTRSGLGELESAFEAAGIEFRFGESSLVYASNEVRDFLALVRAVDDRGDDRDVIAALRTPAFGCSDRDLVEHRALGGSWRLEDAVLEGHAVAGSETVTAALSELGELSELARLLGVVELLEAIVSRRKLRQLLAAGRHPNEALRRLEFVLERARGFVDAGGSSLGELLIFMEQESAIGLRRADAALGLGDLDAVRVLTVHGAKGLEFPLVVLAELGGPPRAATRGPAVLRGPDGRLELSIGQNRATSGFAAIRDAEAEESRREALRLCYVAATRARDHLVISLYHRPVPGGERSLAQLLAAVVPDGMQTGPGGGPLPGAPLQGRFVLAAPLAIDERAYERFVSDRGLLLERISTPTSVVATALESVRSPTARRSRRTGDVAAGGFADDADEDGVSWRRARAASKVGRAVHSVLQRIDLQRGTDLVDLARRTAILERCAEDADEVAALVKSALAAPVVRAAACSPTLHREVPVALPVPGGILEGVVDLCFSTPEGLVGVDYKTDLLRGADEVSEHTERYRLQVGAYAYALGALTGTPLSRFVLVFLSPAGAIEVDLADLPGAAEEARSAASALLGAPTTRDGGPR